MSLNFTADINTTLKSFSIAALFNLPLSSTSERMTSGSGFNVKAVPNIITHKIEKGVKKDSEVK